MIDLLQTLTNRGIIDRKELPKIEEELAAGTETIETILSRRGVSPSDVLGIKGEYYKVPTRIVGDESVPFDVLAYIPEESASHYRFVPLAVKDGVLEVGITDPDSIEALDALSFISTKAGIPYKTFLISETDFEKVREMYKGLSGEVSKALSELDSALTPADDLDAQLQELTPQQTEEKETIREDAPVTKMVATIIRYAVEGAASDIHIEPTNANVKVRFRVDGDLYTSLTLPPSVQRSVVARIKILSSIKLDEKRKPQDGRFSATVQGRKIDFRVSTFPTYHGEKVVMRILDQAQGTMTLTDLGMADSDLEKVRQAIQAPYGIILLTGPTGSGKSTTLYAMLKELDREKRNVVSLEDPIEYNIDGVSQSQVHPEIGYTFATGLRSILRQDPDIIMVGEIRDKETAQLAVQAALTGHLVLATLHTNTAVGAIPRLIDMGVDPYLIAPTLVLTIAQRLVRVLCGSAKKIPVEGAIKKMLDEELADLPEKFRKDFTAGKVLHGIEPTPECPSGTRGRMGVFEMMLMDKELERVILTNPIEEAIYDAARKKGLITMKEDALLKSFKGSVPFEEVNTLGGQIIEEESEAVS